MRKRTLFLFLLMVAMLGATYWGLKQLRLNPQGTSLLRLALDNTAETLDPALAYSDDSLVVSAQVLEPLYQYHYLKRPYEIQSLVAEGPPSFENKGRLVTIKIKKGLRYHDHPAFAGKARELIADDFVNQFKRLSLEKTKSPGRGLFSGLVVGFDDYSSRVSHDWTQFQSQEMAGVTALDDHTLRIQLTRSEPNIVYYLALNFTSPVPSEIMNYYKNDLKDVLIGTGPYILKATTPEYFQLTKFAHYRLDYYPSSGDRYANVQKLLDSSKEKIPFIDEVRFYVTNEEEEGWEKFMKGDIDLLTVPKTFIPQLYTADGNLNPKLLDMGVELRHFPILANRWLGFNMKDPVVGKNEYLRRAIAYAIDYNRYIQVISQNTNMRANSILVPGISGYLPAKDFRFKFDPDLAKKFLAMAGFNKPDDMPTITYSTRGNQSINTIEAEFIKEMLERIGLKVKIQVLSFSDFLLKGRAGELMFFTDNWLFDYPDGENIFQLLVSTNFPGINKSAYSNPEIDRLYQQLKETTNLDQRDQIIHDMEEIVFEDLPWIPMMYESSFVLQKPNIKNFRKSSIIRNYAKYLKMEP